MNVFIPSQLTITWEERTKMMSSAPLLKPFSQNVIDFLQTLSNRILKDKNMRQHPEMMAVGFWLRKSNLHKLMKSFEGRTVDSVLKARGLVLHFAPSNVDTIFIYSWVTSLLAGNSNLIRISNKKNQQIERFINVINDVLDDEKYSDIQDRILVCSYEHNQKITSFLSSYCHCRVIWGGDQTVQTIRAIPLNPLATELVFPDRFSISMLSSKAIVNLPADKLKELAHRFYNDSFWFNQLGCSSPRAIGWVGDQSIIDQAQKRFWNAVNDEIEFQHYSLASAEKVTRMSTAYYFASKGQIKGFNSDISDTVLRIEIDSITENMRDQHCGRGLFAEMYLETTNEMALHIIDKDQTLTYFGFSNEEILNLLEKTNGRGLDRVVPVGQALDFNNVWDGYNLLLSFTREISFHS